MKCKDHQQGTATKFNCNYQVSTVYSVMTYNICQDIVQLLRTT